MTKQDSAIEYTMAEQDFLYAIDFIGQQYFTIFFQFFSEWLVISHIKKVGTEDFSCQPFVFMDEYEIYFSN